MHTVQNAGPVIDENDFAAAHSAGLAAEGAIMGGTRSTSSTNGIRPGSRIQMKYTRGGRTIASEKFTLDKRTGTPKR